MKSWMTLLSLKLHKEKWLHNERVRHIEKIPLLELYRGGVFFSIKCKGEFSWF